MKEPHTDRKFTNRAENPLLHDTWKLLSRYRDVTWSLELSVPEIPKTGDALPVTALFLLGGSLGFCGVCLVSKRKSFKK